jgi:hypothetical protein
LKRCLHIDIIYHKDSVFIKINFGAALPPRHL